MSNIYSINGVTAILGPTNTGKTYLAVERMLAHKSGMIGLPLRLLAREVYDRLVAKIGVDRVALITGEEKIKPKQADYWVSTVEAMPEDIEVECLCIDEVQLSADLERGHIFTKRLLEARGTKETLLLGAETIRGHLETLLPGINVITRPRHSILSYSGSKKLTRLAGRTAIIAFSANTVYEIAELVKRQRGGTAVVMGALSPRTRNAQVEMFQNGDVEFMIATDAIGMGLNLNLDHIAFSATRKFDGFQYRDLNAGELAQIAGRAGRYKSDGSFGVTGQAEPLEQDIVERIENHRFEPIRILQWRNSDLDYSSLASLQESLSVAPTAQGLTRAPLGSDVLALEALAKEEHITRHIGNRQDVIRLWDICQIPDYRKIAPANHQELISRLFVDLSKHGVIDESWFKEQIGYCDIIDGDIDTLSNRVAHIRTWKYITHRDGWLKDGLHWQGVSEEIENRLSDALHLRLQERFVDKRTSILMQRLNTAANLDADINTQGDIIVEGQHVGKVEGFCFLPDSDGGQEAKTLRNAASSVIAQELEDRASRFAKAPDENIRLADDMSFSWHDAKIARLIQGGDLLTPDVQIICDEQLSGRALENVKQRLKDWISSYSETHIAAMKTLNEGEGLEGITRGIAFRLYENLGILNRKDIQNEISQITQEERGQLRRLGVRFGAYSVFVPKMMKPASRRFLAMLWMLNKGKDKDYLSALPDAMNAMLMGRTSFIPQGETLKAILPLIGYRLIKERAIRIDIMERLGDLIRPLVAWRPGSSEARPEGAYSQLEFMVTTDMLSLLGVGTEDIKDILKELGYRMETRNIEVSQWNKWLLEHAVKPQKAEPEGAEAHQIQGENNQVPTQNNESKTDNNGDVGLPSLKPISGNENSETKAGESEQEMITLEFWRPFIKRQNQHQAQSRKQQNENNDQGVTQDKKHNSHSTKGRHKNAFKGDGKRPDSAAKNGKHQQTKTGKHGQQHSRPAKQADPDSPFAVLEALKEQMKQK